MPISALARTEISSAGMRIQYEINSIPRQCSPAIRPDLRRPNPVAIRMKTGRRLAKTTIIDDPKAEKGGGVRQMEES